MSNLVDRYLLFRVKTKQDPEAFARLYDRYVEAIYRFVYLKLPSREDAQDITAETFTKAWQYLNEQHEVVHIRALLYRIARNLIADFFRSQKPNVSLEELVTNEVPIASNEGIRVSDRAEFALVVQKLERLKEDFRDVLTLRLIDDLPFQDIADILEKKPGNVRVIYHRALKALKELDQPTTHEPRPATSSSQSANDRTPDQS